MVIKIKCPRCGSVYEIEEYMPGIWCMKCGNPKGERTVWIDAVRDKIEPLKPKYDKKITVRIDRDTLNRIREVIRQRKEKYRQSNPEIFEVSESEFKRIIERCTISGFVREAIRKMLKNGQV